MAKKLTPEERAELEKLLAIAQSKAKAMKDGPRRDKYLREEARILTLLGECDYDSKRELVPKARKKRTIKKKDVS